MATISEVMRNEQRSEIRPEPPIDQVVSESTQHLTSSLLLSFASIALESHAWHSWHSLEQTPISKSQTASRDKIGHRRRCSHGPISPFRLLVPYQHPSPRPLLFLLEGCPARLTPDSRLGETSWQMLIFAHPILNAGGTSP